RSTVVSSSSRNVNLASSMRRGTTMLCSPIAMYSDNGTVTGSGYLSLMSRNTNCDGLRLTRTQIGTQLVCVNDVLPRAEDEPTIDVRRAGRLLGIEQTPAYKHAQRGELVPGVPVIKIGRQYRVPTAPLLRVLGLDNPIN